jgi:large subunit ribosomal protein L1
MAKHGKKYRAAKAEAPAEAVAPDAAIDFLKKHKVARFDETLELGMRMGVDPKKSENAIRGSVALPHGTGRSVTVAVFAAGPAAEAAREAGADHVGTDELIEKVKEGWTQFDVAIATPEAMKEVRKLGRVLGPRGLMPNPKTGTVTDDTAAAVKAAKAGRVEFRMDRQGNINVPFGKLSFSAEQLAENAEAIVAAVRAERPASARGEYIKAFTMSSTMGPGVRVNMRN